MKRNISIAWLLICTALLAWWVCRYGINPDLSPGLKNESTILLLLGILALTLPMGYVYLHIRGLIAYMLYYRFGVEPLFEYIHFGIYVDWLCMVIIGFVQWFVLVPLVVKKLAAFKKQRATGE